VRIDNTSGWEPFPKLKKILLNLEEVHNIVDLFGDFKPLIVY